MPQVNDALRYSTSTSTFDYTTAGANHVWDFSKIQVANQDVQKYNSALSTPYLLQFLSNSSYGIPQSNQSVGPILETLPPMFICFTRQVLRHK